MEYRSASIEFEAAHGLYLHKHLDLRSGERRGRLERGHQYAEKLFLQNVWWPLIGSFDGLHPEYEIRDWNRRSQFLDFAFLPDSGGKIGIECDGFQSHVKDMDRERFCYSLNRDSFLTGMGWKILHFAFDDIQQRPEICRMLLQLNIGPLMNQKIFPSASIRLSPEEKDILRTAWNLGSAIRPKDLKEKYGFCHRKAQESLQGLARHQLLRAVSNGTYVCKYETVGDFPDLLLNS